MNKNISQSYSSSVLEIKERIRRNHGVQGSLIFQWMRRVYQGTYRCEKLHQGFLQNHWEK